MSRLSARGGAAGPVVAAATAARRLLWCAWLLAGVAGSAHRAVADEPRPGLAGFAQTAPEADPAAEEESQPPTLFLRGFADMNYLARTADASRDASNGFALGEFDLFVTSQIAPDLRVLSELVFHFEEDRDEEFVEVERLLLQYQPADAFGVRLGRLHTSIGHWNHSFHHGTWLQTTIERPTVFQFEDEGGVLPIHSVGVELFGLQILGGLDLQYSAAIFNGRGRTPRQIQAGGDANESKAFSAQLELLPDAIRGLRLGLSFYTDVFPVDPDRPGRDGEMDERVLAGHVVYQSAGAELLAELVRLRHEEPASGRRFDTSGGYVQAAYRVGHLKPFARLDRLDVDEANPLFGDGQKDIDRITVGLRWDPSAWIAVKLEYRSTREAELERSDSAAFQAAFTF